MVSKDEAFARELVPGHLVADRYEVLSVIGRGTTGTVYRARDLHVDAKHERVALKVIFEHLHDDPQIFGRFRREAKILKKIHGPNLCPLLDCVEQDGLLVMVLEYIDGPSLESYLRGREPLAIGQIVYIIKQICLALEAVHAEGVVHRDLKPSNVLIECAHDTLSDGADGPASALPHIRVVDFGLAKIMRGELAGTMLTEHDMVFGTPDYMSPEQVGGDELDGTSDVYSAGVILYRLLVGKLPFYRDGPLTTMTAHLNDPVPIPSEAATERTITAPLDRVLLKALAKEPAKRYATPRELASALEYAVQSGDHLEATPDTEQNMSALHTTLESPRDPALEAMVSVAPRPEIVIRSARSLPDAFAAGDLAARPSEQTPDRERRIWMIVAVLFTVVAVLLGVMLGIR